MKIRRQTLLWTMRLFSTIIILTTQFESSETFHTLSISKEGTLRKRASYESENTNSEFAEGKSKVLTAHIKAWHSFHNSSPAKEQGSESSLKTYECPPTCHCRHGKTNLDLSLNNISHIGRGLFAHTAKLKTLNLYGNALRKLGNGTFAGLDSLNFLTLQSNKLRYLPGTFEPEAFFGLVALETLHIHGNQPDFPANFTYPDEALASLIMLRHLIMDGYPRALGPGFASLVHLSHLSFSSGTDEAFCSMHSEIPPEFFAHLNTKQQLTINMSACSFESIPPQLFTFLPTIHNLDLSFNEDLFIEGFEKASEGLQNSNLSVLNITHIIRPWVHLNEIKNSTFRFLKHTKLKILVVEDNDILKVDPQAVFDLPNTMEYISFQGNKISIAFPLLTCLHMTNLRIEKISRQIGHIRPHKNSSHISAKSEQFKGGNYDSTTATLKANVSRHPQLLPKVLRNRVNLESRYGGNNSAFSLTFKNTNVKDFCEHSDLTPRHLHKHLGSSPFPLPLPKSLEELYASDIKASYDIPRIQILNNRVLKYLDYSLNDIKCFGGPVYGVPNLQHLDLSQNGCFKVNPIFFSSMPSLLTLLLYKNRLGNSLHKDLTGQTFSTLYKLENLDLSYNVIDDMSPAAFVNNLDLQILNLSNNEMSVFQPNLANNSKLQALDLSFNTLSGFSESSCQQFLYIKKRNFKFTVRIRGNRGFLCNCENVYFLHFLLDHPEIFEDVTSFQCRLLNNSVLDYSRLAEFLPHLTVHCAAQTMFVVTVIVFLLVVGSFALSALYHFKRWQWKYLYYMSKSRYQLISMILAARPVVDVFITYDQEYYRQLEVNMAILHELELRRPVVIPVLLLREDRLVRPRATHAENPQAGPSSGASGQSEGQHDTRVARHRGSNRKTSAADDYARFKSLVANFPLEIATFLKGQTRRCLVYEDSEEFWRLLKASIFEE
ncbi:toll-like receptor 4 [Plakobranchus ocellatus]|uniref:Toll-like receptor 4 n=1 Tax=Plakobranchus ocellatus TaxID=259542 RepID=A0AAV4AS84_9GAST|nr:toll-like receptor 4 [Plakobranchus ocellatus]